MNNADKLSIRTGWDEIEDDFLLIDGLGATVSMPTTMPWGFWTIQASDRLAGRRKLLSIPRT